MYYNNQFHYPRQEDLKQICTLNGAEVTLCKRMVQKKHEPKNSSRPKKLYTQSNFHLQAPLLYINFTATTRMGDNKATAHEKKDPELGWQIMKNWIVWYYGEYVKLNQVLWFTLHRASQDAEEVSWVHWNLFLLPPLTSDLWKNIFLIFYPSQQAYSSFQRL